ncbi:hypothetical protein [Kitasatospora sp. NPDC090091]|uniref:hypothetical protein n=1 Tax=Kitasatospora sp. NPDC090091 TaxID=3364081 RepID=UPI003809B6AD
MEPAEFARRQIDAAQRDLVQETARLAEVAAQVHAEAQSGRRVEGDLERLIQYTVSALRRSAQLHGMQDTASYTTDSVAGGAR